jgi:hypothetical protein
LIEERILATIAEAVLPGSIIDATRIELRRRLETPEAVSAGRQRTRQLNRLEQLKKQHSWGDLTDTEYQTERDAIRVMLPANCTLPESPRKRCRDCRLIFRDSASHDPLGLL